MRPLTPHLRRARNSIPITEMLLGAAVLGLICVSMIAGIASSVSGIDDAKAPSALVGMRTARTDTRSDRGLSMPAYIVEPAVTVDPLEEYRVTIGVLRHDYYGGPVGPVRSRELTYEAIRGMLGSLRDQFTSFLDPGEWSQMQATTEGDFEGVGALVEMRAGGLISVVRPIEGSPAEKAGLKAGDVIVSVAGHSVHGRSIGDVTELMKGDPGSHVRIGVRRAGHILDFKLTRALVEPPVVQHWMEDSQCGIGHIVLTEFNERSIDQLDRAFRDLERRKMRALVLDLRGNPGGLLDTAVSVASIFIPEDRGERPRLDNNVVLIREGSGEEKGLKLQPRRHTHGQLPLVVLVNGNSASAAEIVTGAIKDYGVGTVIGERTFGKGRVQTLFPMDDRSALRLTTALYYPPKRYDINCKRDEEGNRIEGTGGIIPDIEIKQSPQWSEEFRDKAHDLQIQAAIRFLRARLAGRPISEAAELARLPLTPTPH